MDSENRLFIKITRDTLPQVKDKYPFIYLERGRLEVDDSSVRWVDADANVVPLPVGMLNTLLLGPGSTVTHDAVRTAAASNCNICWVGEDSLIFYAAGLVTTANTRNFQRQVQLAHDPKKSHEIARKMFERRFPQMNLKGKSLQEMMGMEGRRIRDLYQKTAQEYHVGWKGRRFKPGKFELSDLTNKILTATNAALYGIICSAIHSMGYTPHIGFIHSGSPLPLVYDMADLYKDQLCIDLAFFLTRELAGHYDKYKVAAAFRERIIELNLLQLFSQDLNSLLGGRLAGRHRQ